MRKKANQLEFISRINRNGSGVSAVDEKEVLNKDFKLNSLSISEKTYIASGMNSYVVKIKKATFLF